jgi:hypothetical protein
MRVVLLTVGAWTVISFLFAWLWGVAISRVGDVAGCEFPADPKAACDVAHPIVESCAAIASSSQVKRYASTA